MKALINFSIIHKQSDTVPSFEGAEPPFDCELVDRLLVQLQALVSAKKKKYGPSKQKGAHTT